MSLLVDVISWACILAGSFFAVVGGIGILRLPEFYSRLHGGGITDTMGAGLILVGLMFHAMFDEGLTLVTVKLVMILFLLFVTSPTSCHALASSALAHGVRPVESKKE